MAITIKPIIMILCLGVLSCNDPKQKSSVDDKVSSDTLAHIDTFYIDQEEVNSNRYKEYK